MHSGRQALSDRGTGYMQSSLHHPRTVCTFRPCQGVFFKLHRCHAGGQREPNSFNPLLWGQNVFKRLNKESGLEAESAHASEVSSPDNTASDRNELSTSEQHPELDSVDAQNEELDRRRRDYRHLVFCGRDVTMDYPDDEVPTWDTWQKAIAESAGKIKSLDGLSSSLEEAIRDEDYFTAAELKRDIDAVKAEDVVGNFLQDYRLAVQEQDFDKAAQLKEGCSIDLCGWWRVNTPNDENAAHILRISKAFNKYEFKAYAADALVELHSTQSPKSVPGNEDYLKPTPTDYNQRGFKAAELHFHQFPSTQEPGGQRIYTLATATKGTAEVDPVAASTGLEDSLTRIQSEATVMSESEDLMDSILKNIIEAREALEASEGSSDSPTSDAQNLDQDPRIIDVESQVSNVDDTDAPSSSSESSAPDEGSDESLTEAGMQKLYESLSDSLAGVELRRPLNLLRTEKDRMMLVTSSVAGDLVLRDDSDGASDSSGVQPDGSGSSSPATNAEVKKRVRTVIAIDSGATNKEIAAKLKDMLKGNTLKGEPKVLFDEAEQNLRRQMDGNEPESDSADAVKNNRRKMVKSIAKHVKDILKKAAHGGQTVLSQKGLRGAIGYSRIQLPESATDPFTGLFIGMFGPHGPEIIQVRRVIGQDGKEWIEGTKITGDSNVPAGQLSFKAGIGRDNRMPDVRHLPPELGIRARYKGEGQVAEQGFVNPRWVEGELWHLSKNNMLLQGQPAEIGFLYTIRENKILTPLFRIHLDDPLQDLLR